MRKLLFSCLILGLLFNPFAWIFGEETRTFVDYSPKVPGATPPEVSDLNGVKIPSSDSNGAQIPSSVSGCDGIKLNTNFPIIGNCIGTSKDSKTNPTTAFPKMVGALTKIIMSLILVVCFIFIIVAGIMWAGSGEDNSQVTKAKGILKKVAIVILLLGFSGAILRLINPNFFG